MYTFTGASLELVERVAGREKNTTALWEASVPGHNGDPIKSLSQSPQYNSDVMVRGILGASLFPMMPETPIFDTFIAVVFPSQMLPHLYRTTF